MTSFFVYSLRQLWTVMLVVLVAVQMPACSSSDDAPGDVAPVAWADLQTPSADGGSMTLRFTQTAVAGQPWTARITGDDDLQWVSFDLRTTLHETSGTVGATLPERVLFVYYKSNPTDRARTAIVEITVGQGSPVELAVVQPAGGSEAGEPSVTSWQWPEIPARVENDDFTYVTHYCPVPDASQDGAMRTKRNFTLCFDRTKRASWWVAYPMHEAYLGKGRVETWDYDPEIPREWQPVLFSGYVNGTTWNRGHQIPNADRNADATMQAQTFYFSNMTPQNGTLNQKPWANLEERVRDWRCRDTLYVVTGAYWGADPRTTTDKQGNVCPIPSHYFKVLARTVSGNVRTSGDRLGDLPAAQLMTIGFWVENKNVSTEAPQWVRSVKEIEELTGFEFFPTLPAEVKTQREPSKWGL